MERRGRGRGRGEEEEGKKRYDSRTRRRRKLVVACRRGEVFLFSYSVTFTGTHGTHPLIRHHTQSHKVTGRGWKRPGQLDRADGFLVGLFAVGIVDIKKPIDLISSMAFAVRLAEPATEGFFAGDGGEVGVTWSG